MPNPLNPLPDRIDPEALHTLSSHLGVPLDQLRRLELVIDGNYVNLKVVTTVGATFVGKRTLEWPDCVWCDHPWNGHGDTGRDVCFQSDPEGGCHCDGYVPPWRERERSLEGLSAVGGAP